MRISFDAATMTYVWQVSSDGAFEGIVLMHTSPAVRDRAPLATDL
jgi:hypothetical protein